MSTKTTPVQDRVETILWTREEFAQDRKEALIELIAMAFCHAADFHPPDGSYSSADRARAVKFLDS